MKDLEIKITRELLYNEESEDILYGDEFATDDEKSNNDYISDDIVHIEDSKFDYAYAEDEPINIEHLENMINDAKLAGSTHISIEFHCDHISYLVSGYKMNRMGDVDLKKEEKRKFDANVERIKASIQNKRNKIEKELKELKNLENG